MNKGTRCFAYNHVSLRTLGLWHDVKNCHTPAGPITDKLTLWRYMSVMHRQHWGNFRKIWLYIEITNGNVQNSIEKIGDFLVYCWWQYISYSIIGSRNIELWLNGLGKLQSSACWVEGVWWVSVAAASCMVNLCFHNSMWKLNIWLISVLWMLIFHLL